MTVKSAVEVEIERLKGLVEEYRLAMELERLMRKEAQRASAVALVEYFRARHQTLTANEIESAIVEDRVPRLRRDLNGDTD